MSATRRAQSTRLFVTPEGVPITVKLAPLGSRILAFAIDLALMAAIVAVVLAVAWMATGLDDAVWLDSLALLVSFFVRNFYFAFLELRPEGATYGKRFMGIRVINRKGGALAADAVLARNLMRELELFAPVVLLLGLNQQSTDALWLASISTWGLMLTLLPFFDRDHLRLGDRVGGTLVVEVPYVKLARDMAIPEPGEMPGNFSFTPEQLDVYGVLELQVLEDVLRGLADPLGRRACETVCARIRKRIAWHDRQWVEAQTLAFLREYYAALRARLEHKALLGERREHKNAIPPARSLSRISHRGGTSIPAR